MKSGKRAKTYPNRDHFPFVAGDGKIQEVKVYLDTIHVTTCAAPEVPRSTRTRTASCVQRTAASLDASGIKERSVWSSKPLQPATDWSKDPASMIRIASTTAIFAAAAAVTGAVGMAKSKP